MNVNDHVRVRLTERGKDVLKFWGGHPDQYLTDADGYTRFQMWTLMYIFGRAMGMTAEQVFVKNEILIGE